MICIRHLEMASCTDDVTALTVEDVLKLSPKFWQLHIDPITCLDGAATTLLTIHYNLCLGTLAPYAKTRRDLRQLVKDLAERKVV